MGNVKNCHNLNRLDNALLSFTFPSIYQSKIEEHQMKQKLRLIVGTVLIMLATGTAWGGVGNGKCPPGNPDPTRFSGCDPTPVPEIDAGPAPMALAVLAGGVLLLAERSRRSPQSHH
jgi:hypothetical protein